MAVTTWKTVRDTMVSSINALVPTSYANVPFRKQRAEMDFRAWADENPPAAGRVYAVINLHDYQDVQVSDRIAKLEPGRIEVVIAYPNKWPENDRDLLDQIIDEDRIKVDGVVGLDATAYTNACTIEPDFSVERGDSVTFLVLEYTTIYHRSV